MSDIDPRLKATLDEHGQGVRVVSDLAERAIARNRSNRRRELGVAALGAGLVLAVAVPLTWSSIGTNRSSPLPIGPTQPTALPTTPTNASPSTPVRPSTTSPTAIPTLRATGPADTATLQPATGQVTATTDVGYVVEGVFHEGARTITLPSPFKAPNRVAVLGSGLLVSAGDKTAVLGADGQVVADLPPLGVPVSIASDRSHALVTDQGGNLLYLDSRGKQVAHLPSAKAGGAGWQTVGLVGDMAYALYGDQTRSVAWKVRTGATTTIKGAIGPIDAVNKRAIITSPDLSPGQLGYGYQRLIDLTSGRTVWNLDGPLWFTSFSPDGSLLLGQGYSDGQPPEQWRGSDGKPLYQQLVVARASDAKVVLQGGGYGNVPTQWLQSARLAVDGSITVQIGVSSQKSTLQRCRLDGRCAVAGNARSSTAPDLPGEGLPYLLADN